MTRARGGASSRTVQSLFPIAHEGTMKQKIGVLGSGDVAQTLAKGFKTKGYDVRIGTRDPAKLASFSRESGVPSGTFSSSAEHGDLLVLAVKGTAALSVLEMAGASALAGKV